MLPCGKGQNGAVSGGRRREGPVSLQKARGGAGGHVSRALGEGGSPAGGPTKAETYVMELLKTKYGHGPASFQSQSPRWVEKSHS